MKILFQSIHFTPEQIGVGLYSGDFCRELSAAGHEVQVVAAVPYYPDWNVYPEYRGKGWVRALENGLDVTHCPIYVPKNPTGRLRILHHLSFLLSSLGPMVRAAIAFRPDLVITPAPSLVGAPATWLAAKLSGAKCWLHVQDFEVEAMLSTGLVQRGPLARLGAWFERKVLASFDLVSSISPQMCAKLADKGVELDKIYELRNWADLTSVQPLSGVSPYRAEWSIGTPHVALYSGNIANKQGIELVLEAAQLLRHRTDLTFVVCGQGPNRAKLEEAARETGNIRFHDLQPRERLGDLLGMASVHLLPQLATAADLVLPSKLTNMLASGRPIVATAAPETGLAHEVEGCGMIVPPGDSREFAGAIERLIDNPDEARAFGEAGRRRALERWDKNAIIRRAAGRAEELVGPAK